jgi:hypothetical protein
VEAAWCVVILNGIKSSAWSWEGANWNHQADQTIQGIGVNVKVLTRGSSRFASQGIPNLCSVNSN